MDKSSIELILASQGISKKSWKSFSMSEEDYEDMLEDMSENNFNASLAEEAFDSFDDLDGRCYHIHKRFKTWEQLVSFFED